MLWDRHHLNKQKSSGINEMNEGRTLAKRKAEAVLKPLPFIVSKSNVLK